MKTIKLLLATVTLGLLTFTASAQNWITNGLVAYYPFNGNANDASGNGNDGTVNGATLTTNRFGVSASAYKFSSTSQYIQSAHNIGISGNTARTISLWCKSDIFQPWPNGYMVGWNTLPTNSGESVNLMFPEYPDPYHTYRFMLDTLGDVVLSEPVTNILGKWHHVVWTYQTNLGYSVFYLDGHTLTNAFQDGGASTSTLSTVDSNLIIGSGIANDGFVGLLDDVRIYNRTLSSNEVAQLYLIESPEVLNIKKAVYLDCPNLKVGTNYQVQVSSDLLNWTNTGPVFTATNSIWRSAYQDVADWNQFFRLQQQ